MKFMITVFCLLSLSANAFALSAGSTENASCQDLIPTLVSLRDNTLPGIEQIVSSFESDAETLEVLRGWAATVASDRSPIQNADVIYVTGRTLGGTLSSASIGFLIANRKEKIDQLSLLSSCLQPKSQTCIEVIKAWPKYLLDYKNGSQVTEDLFTSIAGAFQSINTWIRAAVGKTITASTAVGFQADADAARANEPSYRASGQRRYDSLNDMIQKISSCLP